MIRKAEIKDAKRIEELLYQIQDVHSEISPDVFKKGERRFTLEQVKDKINNNNNPIFVYVDENNIVQGYVFCLYEITKNNRALRDRKVLFIDDLCVDSSQRGKKVGERLYNYVVDIAKENDCDAINLHVWNDNPAYRFYEKLGMSPFYTNMEQKLK